MLHAVSSKAEWSEVGFEQSRRGFPVEEKAAALEEGR